MGNIETHNVFIQWDNRERFDSVAYILEIKLLLVVKVLIYYGLHHDSRT